MFDAVDSGVDQTRQGILAEHMRGDPGALGVRGGDGGHQNLIGPQRRQVTRGTIDPVADQLDPAVSPPSLLRHRIGQLPLVFELDGIVLQVTLGPRQMPSSPDDLGKIVVIVERTGVSRRSAVA